MYQGEDGLRRIMAKYPIQFSGLSSILLLLFLWWPATGFTDIYTDSESDTDCITRFDQGAINWSSGKIIAIGKAAPADKDKMSPETLLGTARADANRQIITILQQIKIHRTLSVGKYAARNDTILAGMEKTAWDAAVTRQYYTSGFAVEIRIETSMYGGFMQLVLPEEIRQIPKIAVQTPQSQSTDPLDEAQDYTGLIVDARTLDISPVLNPLIVSEQGDDVYSSVFISREFAVQNGVCKYVCDLETAKKQERIGNRPLMINGLRKNNENNAIVIRMADYQKLEKTTERHTFLAECRVVIVID